MTNSNQVSSNDIETNFALEEYKTLREEISKKMDNQNKILGLGIGGITIIFGAIQKTGIDELFLAMPFLVIANAMLYRSECMAMINAGIYIRKIENRFYGDSTKAEIKQRMGWEHSLNREVYKPFNHVSDIIFLSLYFLSTIKVVHYIFTSEMLCNLTQKIIVLIIYLVFILFLFFRYLWSIFKFKIFLRHEKYYK
ncbi:MAG: hypothetical protein JXB00_02305 [Bacteroidales bacterium]|nr:hypothetical protein [Bacteroidales bacterium]